jgi:hypothetical protein
LSTRPRFSQVVESSSESSIVPPSRVALEATSLATYPAFSPAAVAAWAAMSDQAEGQNQGGQRDGQGGPQGDGGGGNGDGQGRGGQPPLAYHNAALFLAAWNAAPSDQAKDNLEQEAISRSPTHDVQFAAMLKINLQMHALVVQLNIKVTDCDKPCPAGLGSGTQCCKRGSFQVCNTPKVWGQEEGRACGSLDPCDRRSSLNCSRRGLHPVGILLPGGWTPCPVDRCLRGIQEGKRWGRAP